MPPVKRGDPPGNFRDYHAKLLCRSSQVPALPKKHPGQKAMETVGRGGGAGLWPKSLETWKEPASVLHRPQANRGLLGGRKEARVQRHLAHGEGAQESPLQGQPSPTPDVSESPQSPQSPVKGQALSCSGVSPGMLCS